MIKTIKIIWNELKNNSHMIVDQVVIKKCIKIDYDKNVFIKFQLLIYEISMGYLTISKYFHGNWIENQ